MTDDRWLTPRTVTAIDTQAIVPVGGSRGIRDRGLLESALDRPRNLVAYAPSPTVLTISDRRTHGEGRDARPCQVSGPGTKISPELAGAGRDLDFDQGVCGATMPVHRLRLPNRRMSHRNQVHGHKEHERPGTGTGGCG